MGSMYAKVYIDDKLLRTCGGTKWCTNSCLKDCGFKDDPYTHIINLISARKSLIEPGIERLKKQETDAKIEEIPVKAYVYKKRRSKTKKLVTTYLYYIVLVMKKDDDKCYIFLKDKRGNVITNESRLEEELQDNLCTLYKHIINNIDKDH